MTEKLTATSQDPEQANAIFTPKDTVISHSKPEQTRNHRSDPIPIPVPVDRPRRSNPRAQVHRTRDIASGKHLDHPELGATLAPPARSKTCIESLSECRDSGPGTFFPHSSGYGANPDGTEGFGARPPPLNSHAKYAGILDVKPTNAAPDTSGRRDGACESGSPGPPSTTHDDEIFVLELSQQEGPTSEGSDTGTDPYKVFTWLPAKTTKEYRPSSSISYW